MYKKIMIYHLIVLLLLLTGCSNTEKNEDMKQTNTKQNTEYNEIISNEMSNSLVHEHCTREGTLTGGEVSLNYDLYYIGDNLNLLVSEEKVISSDKKLLDEYDTAYRKIDTNYLGLEYYDTEVLREANYVSRKAIINYEKININQLLKIEGEEDNIVEGGVAKVSKWKELAKKFGTTCQVVSEKE